MMRICTIPVVTALLVSSLAPATASAQEPDGTRFRGGVGLYIGPFVLTGDGGSYVIGQAGLQAQLGAQITNEWAVYATPDVGAVFGAGGAGVTFGTGILAEYTFSGVPLSLGAGPYVAGLVVPGNGDEEGGFGFLAGGRLHSAFYPLMTRSDNGIRRKALYVGLDLGLYAPIGAAGAVLISPLACVGYQAF